MEEAFKNYVPLAPFDPSMRDHFTVYDSFPYVCNRDLCKNRIVMSTGNIIKYYCCHLSDIDVSVGAIDGDARELPA